MRISRNLVSFGAVLLAVVQPVLAGPGGFVSLINATPFDWVLVNQHEYQMEWQPKQIIPAGTSHLQYFEYWYHHGNSGDCAAEATYAVMGSPTRQHLTVQARQNGGKRIEVQYHDTLQSLNNPENSLINLGYVHDGVVQFVLASNDGVSYVSSNPPVAWMQGTLSTIGSKTMRTLSMPASHDSGISELTYKWNGIPHNTQTQSVHVYKQLLNGARFFDIRPALYKGKWYTGHFSPFIGRDCVGATGRTIDHIIGDINRFTAEHPGELIVLDITHDANIDRWWAHLSADEWQNLYVKLSAIKDLWVPENGGNLPYDISTAPISTFIKPGSRSAVIIRIPGSAPEPGINLHKRAPPISSINRPADGIRVEPSVYETFNHDEIPVLDKENGFGDPNVTLAPPVVFLNTMFAADPNTAFGPWKQAFFSSNRLPQSGSYAETRWPTAMSSNQLDKLSQQASEGDAPHMSYWILTQYWTDITDFGTPRHSIIHMARKAYRALFTDLWPAMQRENKWPNLIIMDDIHNTEVAALCMGINSYFPHLDTGNQFQKRGTISTSQNNNTKTGEHIRCEIDTRIRNENERRHLFTGHQKAFKRFQDFQQNQTRHQGDCLDFDIQRDKDMYDRKMADIHEQQTSETISVYHNLNNDNTLSPAEKGKIKERLADSQSQERLRLSTIHWDAVHEIKARAEKMRKELIKEQSEDKKAFLARQEKEMNVLKEEQNDFLDNVLKHFFGDDKTPFCPKSRHDWPIPKGMPTPPRPHKNFPTYNYTSTAYVAPTKAYHSVEKNPYFVRPTGAYYTTSKNHYAIPTKAYYSVSSKNPYVVYPTGAYSSNPYAAPSKAYYSTSKAPYHVAPTGGYYPAKNKYHPVPSGAYHMSSTKVYRTGAYHSTSKSPYSVFSTGAYHQSSPTPVNAYSVNSTQAYQPTPNSTFVRPYYHFPSGLRVHGASYGKPKSVYAQPIWSNGTYTTTKAAYGTNIPLPPYNSGPGPNSNPYSISRPSTNITTFEAPQTPQTTTVNGGTTAFTAFSTFIALGTIPASHRPTSTPVYVPSTSEEPIEPITKTVTGGTTTFTVFSTQTVFGILPATPVYEMPKKMTTLIVPAVSTPLPKKMTTLIIPAVSTPLPKKMTTLIVPAVSTPLPKKMTTLIVPAVSTPLLKKMTTLIVPAVSTPLLKKMTTLIVPAVSTPLPKMPDESTPVPSSPVPATPMPTSPVQTIPEQSIPVPTTPLPTPTPSYVTANAARTQVWGILGLVLAWTLAFFWGMV